MKQLLKIPILIWHRLIAPCLPPSCRFYPSCSVYALEALDRHPLHRAVGLIVWRVLRCNPFHRGGYDPVPGPGAAILSDVALAKADAKSNDKAGHEVHRSLGEGGCACRDHPPIQKEIKL